MWYVYILECSNKDLYTGITYNIERRFHEHKSGKGGHFTKSFGVERILYSEEYLNLSLETRSANQTLDKEKEISFDSG